MINTLLGKIFGTKNEREVKRLQPRVAAINALEPEMQKLSDDELRAKTAEFRARIQERLSSIADEPDADPDAPDVDRQKEIEAERSEVLKVVLDELLEEAFAVPKIFVRILSKNTGISIYKCKCRGCRAVLSSLIRYTRTAWLTLRLYANREEKNCSGSCRS